jgi:hypothetical protein
MNKKILLTGILGLAILGIIVYFSAKKENPAENNSAKTAKESAEMILFVGEGCPHCENVEKFIAENNVGEKITIETLEVFKNKENEGIFEEKAKSCGMDLNNLGVPLFWNKGQCLNGDADIINFLKSQIGQE